MKSLEDRRVQEPTPVAVIGSGAAVEALRAIGCEPAVIASPDDLFARRQTAPPWLIVVEQSALPGQEVVTAVESFRSALPLVDVVVWAPRGTAGLVRHAFQAGAKDVVVSSSPRTLAETVRGVLDEQQVVPKLHELADQRLRSSRFESLLTRSDAMWDLFEQVARVAPSDATVLILGETGTGKEMLARAIHRRSGREGRFVTCNCASISPQLIESELFGHERGAFTGALRAKKGLVRHAHEGTLFLDEIGDMPENVQVSLLRLLQEKTVRPVSGHEEIAVDVRIVTATNIALDEAVARGRFREDLFYRLDVIRLRVPPLRERPEDIVFLFGYFIKRLSKHYGVERPAWTDGFLDALLQYGWPGNVRQLENFAERVILASDQRRLTARNFASLMQLKRAMPEPAAPRAVPPSRAELDLDRTLAENVGPLVERIERDYLAAVLRECGGRVAETARQAGISRRTLLRKLKSYGINKADFK